MEHAYPTVYLILVALTSHTDKVSSTLGSGAQLKLLSPVLAPTRITTTIISRRHNLAHGRMRCPCLCAYSRRR
jgi:hypothetical protein